MKHNFKVGDKVKVVKKVKEEDGWDNTWTDDMNDCIGQEFTIESVNFFGIRLVCNINARAFPPSSLELIEEKTIKNKALNQQQIWAALVNGKTITNKYGDLFKFIDFKLNRQYSEDDHFEEYCHCLDDDIGEYSIHKHPEWTDSLPALCWVRGRTTMNMHVMVITEYNPNDFQKFHDGTNAWYYAKPFTEEDWAKYKAKI